MYEFYIDGVCLPIAPSKLEIKIKNQNKTMTLINEGEINLLKAPGLSEISFTALLPGKQWYPFAHSSPYQNAQYYLAKLEQLKLSPKPFYFTIVRFLNNKTMNSPSMFLVSLEDYTITEDAKEGVDISVAIKLRQYKVYGTKIITFTKDENGTQANVAGNRPIDGKPAEATYTIQKGDTLAGIAKKKLGNSAKWKELYTLNKSVIEAAAKKNGKSSSQNGRYIYPGTVLKLPAA